MSIETQQLHAYAVAITVGFVFASALFGFTIYLLCKLRNKTCKAKASYHSIESRCRAICDAIGEAWPEIGDLRGEAFVASMRLRLMESAALHAVIQQTIDARPANGTLFDSIEAVRAAAAKLTELERCRGLLDEAKIGTAGLNLPSKAGVAERVSLLCDMVKRMKHATGHSTQAPAFVWIPSGLEKRAADMLCAFGTQLAAKMYAAQEKRRMDNEDPHGWSKKATGWPVPEGQSCLLDAVAKGDPLDVALYAAFLWYHGEETSLMGYMSVSPALEDAVRLTIATTEPAKMLRESTAYPPFVNAVTGEAPSFEWALSDGENPLHKYAKRIVSRAHALGYISGGELRLCLSLISNGEPKPVNGEDQPGEIPA